jgi:hypothetical protein
MLQGVLKKSGEALAAPGYGHVPAEALLGERATDLRVGYVLKMAISVPKPAPSAYRAACPDPGDCPDASVLRLPADTCDADPGGPAGESQVRGPALSGRGTGPEAQTPRALCLGGAPRGEDPALGARAVGGPKGERLRRGEVTKMKACLTGLPVIARRRNSLVPPAHAPTAGAMRCRILSIDAVSIRGDAH